MTDLPLNVLQTVLLLLPVLTRVRMRVLSRVFKGIVDRLFAEASVVTLTFTHSSPFSGESSLFESPKCYCRQGLTISITCKSQSCLETTSAASRRYAAADRRLYLATEFVIKQVNSLTAIHISSHRYAEGHWREIRQQLLQKHSKTLRCIDVFWMDVDDVDGLFLPELRFLSCRFVPPPEILFYRIAPKLRSLVSRRSHNPGWRVPRPADPFLRRSAAVLPRGLRVINIDATIDARDLLRSPASQSLELISCLRFTSGPRLSGHLPKLETLTALHTGTEAQANTRDPLPSLRGPLFSPISAGPPDLRDRTCLIDFLDAHASTLRHLRLFMQDSTLLRKPTRSMEQMRNLSLGSFFASNVIILVDSMRFLQELQLYNFSFHKADLVFKKLATMTCLERLTISFGRFYGEPDQRPRDSILAFLTGDSATRLRFLCFCDSYCNDPSVKCWLQMDLEILRQVDRMLRQHSLQTAILCHRLRMQSVNPASRLEDHILQQTSSGDRLVKRYWNCLHQLENRSFEEEQVCTVCGNTLSPGTRVSVDG